MYRFGTILTILVWMCWGEWGWAQTEFPIGVFTWGMNDFNYSQFDTLKFGWVKGDGSGTGSGVEVNPVGLNVISFRVPLSDYAKAQRLRYEAELPAWTSPGDQSCGINFYPGQSVIQND